MRTPNFEAVALTDDCVLIRDLGPWDQYPTITNSAEEVVAMLAPLLLGRRLEYYDSDGERTELLVSSSGTFAGFSLPRRFTNDETNNRNQIS